MTYGIAIAVMLGLWGLMSLEKGNFLAHLAGVIVKYFMYFVMITVVLLPIIGIVILIADLLG